MYLGDSLSYYMKGRLVGQCAYPVCRWVPYQTQVLSLVCLKGLEAGLPGAWWLVLVLHWPLPTLGFRSLSGWLGLVGTGTGC